MKWEYLCVNDATEDRLNALGANGWELIGVYPLAKPRANSTGSTVTQIASSPIYASGEDFEFPVTDGRFVFKRAIDPITEEHIRILAVTT